MPKCLLWVWWWMVVVGLLTLAGLGILSFFRSNAGGITVLMSQMAQIVEDASHILPASVLDALPDSAESFQQELTRWLQTHSAEIQVAGKQVGRVIAHILVGMILGGMLALREVASEEQLKPLACALLERANLLSSSFNRIVFAQVRIAAINATFTGLYLAVALPLWGIELPLVKTMIALTFLVGLIPVLGNLISNTVIVIVSLSHSFSVSLASLIFLVVIHKLEYFLNARIIGGQIHARAWELLMAMLLMESAFGITGVIAAPIYYAYLKSELRACDWI